jgi:hypothetical protein
MKLASAIALLFFTLVLIFVGLTAVAQEPQPFHADKTLKALWLADSATRLGDGITTYLMLSNKCRCIHEVDPIAPHSSNIGKITAFQAGIAVGLHVGSMELEKHHHDKLAKTMLLIDIGSESGAIVNNSLLIENAKGVGR